MTYGGASLKILMTSGRGTREENKKSRFKNKKKNRKNTATDQISVKVMVSL